MKKENKTIRYGEVLCAFLAFITLLLPFNAHTKRDGSHLFAPTKINLLPTRPSKELNAHTIFKANPEFYKLNTVLSNNSKVHFKNPLEQDLYFFFGPYIKSPAHREKIKNRDFNKVLRELFKFHFN